MALEIRNVDGSEFTAGQVMPAEIGVWADFGVGGGADYTGVLLRIRERVAGVSRDDTALVRGGWIFGQVLGGLGGLTRGEGAATAIAGAAPLALGTIPSGQGVRVGLNSDRPSWGLLEANSVEIVVDQGIRQPGATGAVGILLPLARCLTGEPRVVFDAGELAGSFEGVGSAGLPFGGSFTGLVFDTADGAAEELDTGEVYGALLYLDGDNAPAVAKGLRGSVAVYPVLPAGAIRLAKIERGESSATIVIDPSPIGAGAYLAGLGEIAAAEVALPESRISHGGAVGPTLPAAYSRGGEVSELGYLPIAGAAGEDRRKVAGSVWQDFALFAGIEEPAAMLCGMLSPVCPLIAVGLQADEVAAIERWDGADWVLLVQIDDTGAVSYGDDPFASGRCDIIRAKLTSGVGTAKRLLSLQSIP